MAREAREGGGGGRGRGDRDHNRDQNRDHNREQGDELVDKLVGRAEWEDRMSRLEQKMDRMFTLRAPGGYSTSGRSMSPSGGVPSTDPPKR